MGKIFEYVRKYGDYTFQEKAFNDVDNLVLCALFYIDLTNTIVNDGEYTLEVVGRDYLEKTSFKEVSKRGISQRNAYMLLKLLITKARYKKIILSDYVYDINPNKMFGAITFKITNNLSYICFEGTDEQISGWREDGELAYRFPVESQVDAINYVNRHVSLLGPKVIIGGHSKGGNLALISAMYLSYLKKLKVLKVYSNDGPGLRKKEMESKQYRQIKNKYIHFVPENSVVGVMLRSDTFDVVKTTKKSIISHLIINWIIEDDKVVDGTMTEKSKKLYNSMISWLDKHNDEEREKTIDSVFNVLSECKITTVPSIMKIESVIKILQNLNTIDKQTKDLLKDLIVYNYKNVK